MKNVILLFFIILAFAYCSKDTCRNYDLYIYFGEEVTDSLMYHTTSYQCWEDWELQDGKMYIWTYIRDSAGNWMHDSTGRFVNCLHLYVKP